MEYLPLGNLQDQQIAEEETPMVLHQGLQVLAYLHSQGLVHRDIKPENILVYSRAPFSIKFSDFGLATDKSILNTHCGTYCYAAPETWKRLPYTSAVDIWSLAVIVFQYGYGLPKPSRKSKGPSWCEDIIRRALDWDSDPLIDFLCANMLKMKPQDRLSASDCLESALALRLFDTGLPQTGCATPKAVASQHDCSGGTGSTTVILNALWKDAAKSMNNVENRLGSPESTSKRLPTAMPGPSPKRPRAISRRTDTSKKGREQNGLESIRKNTLTEVRYSQYTWKGKIFRECMVNNYIIRMRLADKWICFNHLAVAAGQSRG